mgnify:CR=1 FL=1
MRRSSLYFAFRSDRHGAPVFDLAGACRDGQVCQKIILCLSGPVGNDGAVPCSLRHLHRIQRLRERSDLVYLDQNRICRAKCNAAGKPSYIRHKQIIPTSCTLFPSASVICFQPSKSSSHSPSSMDTIGYFSISSS